MKHTLTNREAYHLAQILAKENMANKFITYFQNELSLMTIEKQTIFKVYGLPGDMEFDFDETTNEVGYEDTK